MPGLRELRSILDAYAAASAKGSKCVLATVVKVEGSSYRRPGARMLITDDGELIGCVSGGCLERDLVRRAGVLRSARAEHQTESAMLLRYDTRDDLPDGELNVGLGCNGLVDIWLELLPIDSSQAVLARFGELLAERRRGVVTVLDAKGAPLLVESFAPPVPWVLFGAGYDAIPMARLGNELGWEVSVVDCRSSLPVPRSSFAGIAKHLQATPETACSKVELTAETCAIVMTHNYDHDLEILAGLLPSPVRYVGLLGPRKRAVKLLDELRSRGLKFGPIELVKLHAPVGLDLGAETPEEIALSVVAEVRAELGGRTAMPLRERTGPIHERSRIAAYLLAAGESRRMGRPKQCLDWRGTPLVVHAARQAAAAGYGVINVVRGAHAELVTAAFDGDARRLPEVHFIDNPDWASGPGSSVKRAIAHAKASGASAALLFACDQPLLTETSFRRLTLAFTQCEALVAAAYADTVGVPAIFPASFYDELLTISDEAGAKRVLERHRAELTAVPLAEGERDLDTPDDYAAATSSPTP